MSIPIVSLFCGAGGLDLGFKQQEFSTMLALDSSRIAVSTYNHNHGNNLARVADLTNSNGSELVRLIEELQQERPRGIIGGPPCQSFSAGNAYYKPDDVRHTLPKAYAAILKTLNGMYDLDFFLFENVRGLTNQRHREEFSGFKEMFEEAGFTLYEGLLDAQHFDVPQRRLRLFVVGFNRDKFKDRVYRFPSPETLSPCTVAGAIGSLPEPAFYEHGLDPSTFVHHRNHWAMRPRSAKFQNGFLANGTRAGKSFRVLSWDKPSYTVAYGHNEVHIHPSGIRRLSIFEAMLLQGFPESYELLGTMSDQIIQVSNAVPPPLANALARSIRLFLENHPDVDLLP